MLLRSPLKWESSLRVPPRPLKGKTVGDKRCSLEAMIVHPCQRANGEVPPSHPSAGKGDSPKSEHYGASSRASKATRKAVILPSSTCSQLATATGEATVVCMSYQVSASRPSTNTFRITISDMMRDRP